MFPQNEYTPYGYLDNPFHTWKLNRSGVIRVNPPCGFGWLFPNAQSFIYRTSLNVGIQLGNHRLLTVNDFRDNGVHLICSYHTKNLFRFKWHWQNIDFSVEYFLADEHVLAANIDIHSSGKIPVNFSFLFLQSVYLDYLKTGLWDFGLTGRFDKKNNSAIIKSFAEGYCFIIKSSLKCKNHIFDNDLEGLQNQKLNSPTSNKEFFSTTNPSLFGLIEIPVEISDQSCFEMNCVFTRSFSESQTKRLAENYLPKLNTIRFEKIKEDSEFWRSCPKLKGDWPDHWKRGWVYDWETLRMNVREPVGIFSTRWDAMQIQKPRIVLAETALDMLMMSYAKPEISQEVILGLFNDALSPQVPCAREDGSLNMISEDGSECGTSPAWCFPFYCFESVVMRHFNREWLTKVVPYLEKYLDWWLKNRTDEEGWAFYNCSWESGQDDSSKFLVKQATGGEIVSHLRAVDLQAAMAQSANILSFFASCLNQENKYWKKIHQHFENKTLGMWQEDWFCDFDKRTNDWLKNKDYRDITNLAPFFSGIYTEDQTVIARKWFEYFKQSPKYWLEWASFFFMYLEACWQVGFKKLASQVLFNTVDRVYKNWDRRDWQEGEPMPGISVECWGYEKPYGSEGYGWAATLPLHIIRCLIGYREYQLDFQNSFLLCPNFPEELLIPGNTYAISSLKFQDKVFSISYEILYAKAVKYHLNCQSEKSFSLMVIDENENIVFLSEMKTNELKIQQLVKNQNNYRFFFS
jgi:hypothetical protein